MLKNKSSYSCPPEAVRKIENEKRNSTVSIIGCLDGENSEIENENKNGMRYTVGLQDEIAWEVGVFHEESGGESEEANGFNYVERRNKRLTS